MSIASEISRLQTAKSGIKTALNRNGISVPNAATLDSYPDYIDSNGHAYVEIGGVKWATMNIGASSVTDYGLYFQWGDTTGYNALQVGTSETSFAKPFQWADYKFGNGSNQGYPTKYNTSDTKQTLDHCDDAARANWGGSWRIPTEEDFRQLMIATSWEWTNDYNGSGVTGVIFTDRTDSSKVLFFPAAGRCYQGSVHDDSVASYCWENTTDNSNYKNGFHCVWNGSEILYQRASLSSRSCGHTVRAVLG